MEGGLKEAVDGDNLGGPKEAVDGGLKEAVDGDNFGGPKEAVDGDNLERPTAGKEEGGRGELAKIGIFGLVIGAGICKVLPDDGLATTKGACL